MPFSRPTLTELRRRTAAEVASELPAGADPLLRFNNLTILAKVLADLANAHYGYLDYIARMAVPWTTADEYLVGWAALKNVFQKEATAGTGTVTFTGTAGTIPLGAEIARGDGVLYTTTADATLVSGTCAVPVAAQTTGVGTTLSIGMTMRLSIAINGINAQGTVSAVTAPGTDVESDDAFRARMLQVYQEPPQGGAIADYREWALAVSGVTRAWCVPLGMGQGTVIVYTMFDKAKTAYDETTLALDLPQGSNGVAAAETRDSAATGDQLTVANAIYPLRPVTALVYASAPTPAWQAFTISGLSGASAATKLAVRQAIEFAKEPGSARKPESV